MAKRDESKEKSKFFIIRPSLSGKMNSPCLKPFFSQNITSLCYFPFGRFLKDEPATKLPLGIKLTGF
jgi:hypothetical protein